jgi:hypothetical protein
MWFTVSLRGQPNVVCREANAKLPLSLALGRDMLHDVRELKNDP